MRVGRLLTVVVVLTVLSGCAWIDRSSSASRPAATQGNGPSGQPTFPNSGPSVSQSGRFVAFSSDASNLVPDDTNGVTDVFVHDHVTGATERVSIGALGFQGDTASYDPSISDDGRFVAFSTTTGLFSNPPARGDASRVFLRDRQLGTTTPVFGLTGTPALPTISGNGRFVAFVGGNPDETSFRTPGTPPIVFDVATQTAKQMPIPDSIDSSIFFEGSKPSLSDDGSRITYSYVVRPPAGGPFVSTAIVTVVADTTTAAVIATARTATIYAAHPTDWLESAISGDGSHVYVILAEGVTGTLYRYDFQHPGLEPIITDISHPRNLRISDDGSVIGFREDGGFAITDANGSTPRIVSADNLGYPVSSLLGTVDLSGDGKWIAFASNDPDLVADDTNDVSDVFVRANGYELVPPS
jgi:WD40-like Beta Propeller Repeat